MVKKLKLDIGEINNHLSILERLCREDTQKKAEEAFQKGLEDGTNLREPVAAAGRLRGLEDAWEAARKIGHASQMQLKEMGFEFNSNEWLYNPSWYVVMNYTAAEVIEKIKAYEEKPKTDDEIKVGDEMQHVTESGTETGVRCIVFDIKGDYMRGIASDGHTIKCSSQVNRWWKKTGRHFNVEEILDEMKHED